MASPSSCLSNCTRSGFLGHEWTAEELWAPWEVLSDYFEYQPWLFSLLGSAMVGLSGVFPLLVIPIDEAADLKHGDSAKTLKILLSFAVGGLLGDVFLHLLPEAWANHAATNTGEIRDFDARCIISIFGFHERKIKEMRKSGNVNHASMGCGLWVLCGFLVFVIAEKLFSNESNSDEDENDDEDNDDETAAVKELTPMKSSEESQKHENNNCNALDECLKVTKNGYANGGLTKLNGLNKEQTQNILKKLSNGVGYGNCNGYTNGFAKINGVKSATNGFCAMETTNSHDEQLCEKKVVKERTRDRPKHISGYLNLMANCVDNFTHGLAVGGSFLVSFRLGALTTFAILIHEIPHEIGDFAILLRSGFNRWDAAKAQLMTATGGMCGAFVAVVFSGDAVESKTSWILPFTAGGFLHIGMVTVLPELLKETDPWESLKQIGALLTGIVVMAFLTIMCD